MTRKKKDEIKAIENVPMERSNRKCEVSSGNASEDKVEKKKALSPNAERGKAVAVPRWFGQFNAAENQ